MALPEGRAEMHCKASNLLHECSPAFFTVYFTESGNRYASAIMVCTFRHCRRSDTSALRLEGFNPCRAVKRIVLPDQDGPAPVNLALVLIAALAGRSLTELVARQRVDAGPVETIAGMRGSNAKLLRRKLDLLGYTEPLQSGSAELVGRLVEDLIRLTESYTATRDELERSRRTSQGTVLTVNNDDTCCLSVGRAIVSGRLHHKPS